MPYNPGNIGVPLQCWYLSTAAYDGSGNPCSGASDNCALLVDQSGNNYSLTQPTSGNRPTWLPNQIAGLPAIQFGASSTVDLYNANTWISGVLTVLFVVNVTSTAPNVFPTLCNFSSSNTSIYFPQNTNTVTTYAPVNSFGPLALNTWHYGGVVIQSGDSFCHFDGYTNYGPLSGSGSPGSGLTLGAQGLNSPVYPLPCLLAEFMVFNGALTPLQLVELDQYFQARYASQFPSIYGVENYASRAEISFQRGVAPPPSAAVSFWRRRVSGRQPTDRSPALPGGPAGV